MLSGICLELIAPIPRSQMRLAEGDPSELFLSGEAMTPTDFFRDAPFGSKIRYGNSDSPIVTVGFIVRGRTKYAHGKEEGTDRPVFLILDDQKLKDPNRGSFDSVEILE